MSEILRNFFPSTTRRFVGRGDLLRELADKLVAAGPSSPIVAVVGIMGAGKTRLVAEFAEMNKAQYRVIWRVRAGSAATLAEDYANLASPATEKEKGAPDRSATIRSVRDRLRKLDRWLLVFDDATDPAMLVDYIPRPYGASSHVVIVSRNPVWFESERTIKVGPLKPEESAALLRQGVGKDPGLDSVQALAREVGYLPGALEMAIQHMQATGTSLSDYLRQLRKQPGTVLKSGLLYGNKQRLLTDTWSDAVARLQRDTPCAMDLFTLCAFMAPKPIPLRHLRTGLQALPGGALGISEVAVCNDGLAALQREGLADLSQHDICLNKIHCTLIRSAVPEDDRKRWVGYAAQVLRSACPEHPSGARKWADYDALIPHLWAVWAQLTRLKLDTDLQADLLQRLGLYHMGKGYPRRARGCLERAASLHAKAHILPCNHVARDLELLGDASQTLAEWNDAQGYYYRAQWYYQRYRGAYDAAIAAILAKRGVLACSRGRFDEAADLCQKALEIDLRASRARPKPGSQPASTGRLAKWREILLVPGWRTKKPNSSRSQASSESERRNPDSSAILRAYGHVLLDCGRPPGYRVLAEAQFTEAHNIDLVMFKAKHPFEARDFAGLGRVREQLGAFRESASDYAKALEIDRKAFGEKHPQVAEDLRNLAHAQAHESMHSSGSPSGIDLSQAKKDALSARQIDEALLGSEHPNVAWDLVSLGHVCYAAGNQAEAESALEQAKQIAEGAYGLRHPWVTDITGQWLDVRAGAPPGGIL